MIPSSQKLSLSLTLVLFCLPMFPHAQATESGVIQSLPLGEIAVQSDALPRADLIVTPYPLDQTSKAENEYRRAVTFAQQEQNSKAEAQLQQALSQQDDHLLARELLVSLLLKRHAIQEAINVLDTGIAIAPKHSKFPLWLAQLYSQLDAPEQALHVLEQNSARFNQHPEYLGTLASFYQLNDLITVAHQYFLQAAKLAPQDGRWWLGIGMTAEAQEDWAGAQNAYRRARDYSFIDGPLLQFAQQRLIAMDAQLRHRAG